MAAKRLSRTSIIICIVVIVVVAIAYTAWVLVGASSANGQVVIHDGNDNETTLSLSEDQTKTITTSLGTNVVVIENGEVYVSEADCPNHDCMEQGKISRNGQQIICLPHKLWVEVVSPDGSDDGSGDEPDVSSR